MAKTKSKAKRTHKPKKPAPVAAAPKPALVKIQVNAKFLRGLRHIAAKNDIRYYLNGVYFTATKAGGKFYVATDGHRIAVLQEAWKGEEPQDVALIIPRSVCAKATPLLKGQQFALLEQLDPATWLLRGAGEIHQQFKAIDGKYPEWQRVVPDAVSGTVGAYNWTYLHEFNLCAKDAFGYRFSVELRQNGDMAGIVTCGDNSFLGMVMPMRANSGSVPEWATAIQKENAARKAKEKQEQEARDRAASNASEKLAA